MWPIRQSRNYNWSHLICMHHLLQKGINFNAKIIISISGKLFRQAGFFSWDGESDDFFGLAHFIFVVVHICIRRLCEIFWICCLFNNRWQDGILFISFGAYVQMSVHKSIYERANIRIESKPVRRKSIHGVLGSFGILWFCCKTHCAKVAEIVLFRFISFTQQKSALTNISSPK